MFPAWSKRQRALLRAKSQHKKAAKKIGKAVKEMQVRATKMAEEREKKAKIGKWEESWRPIGAIDLYEDDNLREIAGFGRVNGKRRPVKRVLRPRK